MTAHYWSLFERICAPVLNDTDNTIISKSFPVVVVMESLSPRLMVQILPANKQ